MKTVLEYMTPAIHSVCLGQPIAEAIRIMQEKKIGAILVFDEEEELLGIFTERDLLNKMDCENSRDLMLKPVDQVMTRNLIIVDASQPYTDAIELMKQYNIRHMPVKKDGQVIGIVSARDLMRKHEEFLQSLLQEKEDQMVRNIDKIKESEERFRLIFNNSSVGIVFADNNQRIIDWNPLFAEMLKMNPEDLKYRPAQDLFSEEEWQKIKPEEILKKGGQDNIETRILQQDQVALDVDAHISVLKDSNGQVQGYIGIMNDIRKRKEAEAALEKSNADLQENAKMLKIMVHDRDQANLELKETQQQLIQMEKMATLGTLAAGFAHEVKNPLAIILQGMERIEKVLEPLEDANAKQFAQAIKRAALRANTVVSSLLRFSRSSRLETEQTDLLEIINGALELVRNTAEMKQIDLKTNFDRIDFRLEADKVMLQQVFFDLLTNAIDAMGEEGGQVEVSVSSILEEEGEKEDFLVLIRDSGHGIPEESLPKIFDPFYTTKDEGKGTGLGLSTVFLILERHNGTIKVSSKVGEGTEFAITLPKLGAMEIKRRFKNV